MPEAPEAEPNDSAVKANKIETPVTVNGRIGQVGDVDCFTFKVEAQQKLIMEVRARRLDSPLDSIIALFDSKGQELAEDDDTVDLGAGMAIHHADSQVVYTFPSAGDYVLKLRDAQSKGGEEYAYRLTVAAPRPDFLVQITPDNPRLGQGGSATLTAYAARRGDFGGEVRIAAKDLPQGFLLSDAVIPAGQNRVRLTVTAPVDAPLGIISPTFTGTATIGTKEIVREAVPVEDVAQAFAYQHKVPTKEFLLTVMESASLVMSADVPPKQVLEIPQGGAAEMVLKVSRKKGTKGAVQLAKYAPVIEGMATMPVAELITVKPVTVAPTKSEAKITVAASVEAPVGLMECIVITGDMKAGKETFTGVAPAISVKVVAPKSKKK
jgi:hypothetical protein